MPLTSYRQLSALAHPTELAPERKQDQKHKDQRERGRERKPEKEVEMRYRFEEQALITISHLIPIIPVHPARLSAVQGSKDEKVSTFSFIVKKIKIIKVKQHFQSLHLERTDFSSRTISVQVDSDLYVPHPVTGTAESFARLSKSTNCARSLLPDPFSSATPLVPLHASLAWPLYQARSVHLFS